MTIDQGEYGEKGIGSFIQLATKSGICIGVSITINRNAANQEFLKVLSSDRDVFASTTNYDLQQRPSDRSNCEGEDDFDLPGGGHPAEQWQGKGGHPLC